MKHFLVTRKVDLGLARVEVFASHQRATRAFNSACKREEKKPSHKRASVSLFPDASNLAELIARSPGHFDCPAPMRTDPNGPATDRRGRQEELATRPTGAKTNPKETRPDTP